MRETLCYSDVLIVPQYSDIETRKEVSLSSKLGFIDCDLPIIASPMDTVSEVAMAKAMDAKGGIAIIHRYNSVEDQARMVAEASEGNSLVGAAVGTTGDFLERAYACYEAGADVICVDVAHGHHSLMKQALKLLRQMVGDDVHIMAGNVATLEGYEDLATWGADSVRANIGGGCFTPGTLVRGPEGDTPIEEVRIGDKVFSHTGEVREVIDTLTFSRDEEIMVINGIQSTKNHEYYVVDIENADKVNDSNIHTFAYWLEAEHLDMNKHLLIELED